MVQEHTEFAFIDAHADWECGRDGTPCRFGPDQSGRCCMRAECTPQRERERWLCNRPIGRGGACEKGPLPDGSCCYPATPCLPRATPRRKFKTAWRLALVISFGVMLVLLSSRAGLAPGPMSPAHASFEEDCQQCHAGVSYSFIHLTAEMFRGGKAIVNSGKCLTCHAVGEAALAAHGVDGLGAAPEPAPDTRPTAPLEVRAAALLAPARLATTGEAGEISCNTCHRLHQGRDSPASSMTDTQCQVCHRGPFDGLAEHPVVAPYPHHDDMLIAFDHASHFRRHFATAEKDGVTPPTDCVNCHPVNSAGTLTVGGFETCASCHAEEITDPAAGNSRLIFLAPPGLDLEVLADASIGEWPEFAEETLNEFSVLMLEAGGYLSTADLAAVADLDLFDLSDATATELQAVTRLAWAFKALSHALVRTGPAIFVEPAQRLHPEAGHATAWTDLAASLPFDVATRAARQWFPSLADELRRRADGEMVPTLAVDHEAAGHTGAEADADTDIDEWLRFGGWHSGYLALEYRPSGHADRFMHGWLAFSAAPTPHAKALFQLLTDEEAPGNCAKCHVSGPEHAPRQPAQLSWAARGSPLVEVLQRATGTTPWLRTKPFTHLSHQQAIANQGCASCHQMAAKSTATQPSGFTPHSVQECATCHQKDVGLGDCVSCHVYHFKNFESDMFREKGGLTDIAPTPASAAPSSPGNG